MHRGPDYRLSAAATSPQDLSSASLQLFDILIPSSTSFQETNDEGKLGVKKKHILHVNLKIRMCKQQIWLAGQFSDVTHRCFEQDLN